ncbi:hypothetical protein [Mesorhizobium sp. B2-3-4]|uniref:hypothetical protein n=1 Tax=Mesorhizobium sp. B2-3-4 TaxID=2589959 RepID=UPI00112B97D1|nr:hypothetical protein [Mesorhizobium sp. B2-3-4]TPM41413.1 hypothetical protein FJ967_00300 [Mesorhizobium sp. B2-3-4]
MAATPAEKLAAFQQADKSTKGDDLFAKAVAGEGGLTVIPAHKLEGNHTVEAVKVDGKPVIGLLNSIKHAVVRVAK